MRQMLNYNDYSFSLDTTTGRFIIYLRKSREDMFDGRYLSDEETLSRHEEQLQSWAEHTLGYRIPEPDIYREVASGEKISARPVFKEILSLIEKEDIAGILVVNPSRLSRGDMVDTGNIMRSLKITETLVLTPQKIFNLQNKHDFKYLRDELLRSSEYLDTTKELLSNGRHFSVSQGKFVGSSAPFGYDKVTCKEMKVADERGYTLRPNDNAEYVQLIFQMFADGIGLYRIAGHLKDIGAPLDNNKEWDNCRVRRILNCSTYCGQLTWGKVSTKERMIDGEAIEYRSKNKDYPIYKGLHTPIVSETLYEAVQARMSVYKDNPVQRHLEVQNSLAGLLKCGICGKAMVRQKHNKKIRKRKHSLDKHELQRYLKRYKKALKLSNIEVANRIGIKTHYCNEWFGNNPQKFYPSELFVDKWYELKTVLQIEDNSFDAAITEFEDVRKPDTIYCSGHRCTNISSHLHIVEQNILSQIMHKISDYKYYLDNYAEEIIKQVQTNSTRKQDLESKIALVNKQLKNAKMAFEMEVDTLEEYVERKQELSIELKSLQQQLESLEEVKEEDKIITIKKAVPKLERVFADYHEMTPEEQNNLLKTIIENIIYTKTDNDIQINICWLILD